LGSDRNFLMEPRSWGSKLGFKVGVQSWGSKLGFKVGVQSWGSKLGFKKKAAAKAAALLITQKLMWKFVFDDPIGEGAQYGTYEYDGNDEIAITNQYVHRTGATTY
jgi:hypothetical protein